MFIPLTAVYSPPVAQTAAAVLRAHGIAAWVTGDVPPEGEDAVIAGTGGCRLMVAETDAAEAERILESRPLSPAVATEPPVRRPFTLPGAMGTGLLQGAVWLPLITVALQLLLRVIAVLRGSAPAMRSELPVFAEGFWNGMLVLSMTGALLGLVAGLAAWLLSSYRRHGRIGFAFVLFIVLLLAVPELLHLLLN